MDVEMSGLGPARNVIVEIATLVTDENVEIDGDGLDLVVHQPLTELARMEDVVREMHTSSGLLKEIEESTLSVEDAGRQTLEYIKAHVPEARSVPLCGNSIGTDRRFLAAYMPDVEEYLHYRSIDVSSIKELAKRWFPKECAAAPPKNSAHRALGDIRESLAELQYYRDAVFKASD